MAYLSIQDQDLILHILLQIDDPAYLAHFQDPSTEEAWLQANEAFIQHDLQRFFPPTIDTADPETWRYIRGQLLHVAERGH
ncbi:hypothetical protein [Levilactobacillus namurensis]|uniref:Uncharacterized protein n=1 Tax=Levilactobacillus namurensis TaxID=380393 RepID=A0AAW8W4M3_9LACO|nr:hypothetical protein [Levilactobacillus namurensis]MDT7013815.1 hypothetical protein [Levilactobacillus namurensis]